MQTNVQTIPWGNLKVGALLGHGGYGDVYSAQWSGRKVAIKQLHLKTLAPHLFEEFMHEAEIMAQCQFLHIVGLYGVCMDEGHTSLVMEFMPKSLYGVLHDKQEKLGWNIRWEIAIDVGKGISYLHNKNILHRDLKSQNVLLDNDYYAKLCDFGLSKIKLETSSTITNSKAGTVRWRAPETFKRGYKPSGSMDVYSYGMVLWEIAARALPFSDAIDELTVMGWIKDGEKEIIPGDCPDAYAAEIKKCWFDEQSRPSAQEIVDNLMKAKPIQDIQVQKSWHFDPATERKAAVDPDNTKPYQILEATEKDKQKVISFYQHHPVPGYEIGSVKVIYNRIFNQKFNLQLETLQQKHNNTGFAPSWNQENNPQWRAETDKKLEDLARPHTDGDYPAVKILPLWHGTKSESLDSLFRIGYENLAKTDGGFFGKGLYGAHEAEYSHRVYAKGALILNWVATFSAYPVIDGDQPKLVGKGNYQNYDAHFAPVVPQNPNNPNEVNYFPCKPYQKNNYTELVTFQSASCLPRYLVELQSCKPQTIINSNHTTQTNTPNQAQKIQPFSQLQNPFNVNPFQVNVTQNHPSIQPHLLMTNQCQQVQKLDDGKSDYDIGFKLYFASQYKESLPWLEAAAKKEYPPAFLRLAVCAKNGLGEKKDAAKGEQWNQKAATKIGWFETQAKMGDAHAQFNFGMCCQFGIGITQDDKLAVKYYQLAADQGNANAQSQLGKCYYFGNGITQDYILAVKYYQLAANQGLADAQYSLGTSYWHGTGVSKNLGLAVKYYQLAADQKHAPAQWMIGVCYCNGQGVTRDYTLAKRYFQLAADQGNEEAKASLQELIS